MSVLSDPHFHDEAEAYKFVEARIWPNGPVCPHCGGFERISKMEGKSTRIGTYKCYQCRKPFTVKIGTIFEASHVKLNHWLQAIFLIASSKKGISSNQLHRTLGVTLKTAWFISHRIREAMRDGKLGPLGGNGMIVEADETYFGKTAEKPALRTDGKTPFKFKSRGGPSGKRAVLGLIERGGNVRTFHVAQATKVNVAELVTDNVHHESTLYTDESRLYTTMGDHFAAHDSVKHSAGEYVRGVVHSNTIESYFSIFKRGMRGTYQHCAEKHLHRYLAEFDFRHNSRVALGVNDVARADRILDGVVGKRLTYRTTSAR
ncbi:IS1595 family transposase [Mesorhizobium sp. CO1-1-11]|uniref:IS1595 family transposase n=1 Tax=Mesorhizobium sp. CO1-1-11 TaxID=2876636 RepID=UPI001CC96E49|nr:IS1595 family transposase [Mesorhizobium sp. CO1-1-11]MBZ9726814.1 IS1595 family transposase [Mesorhizobium sp. CO1-1-11]